MAEKFESLTGVWHGLYSYPYALGPVYFVATLISYGQHFNGTTHEATEGYEGAALQRFASVDGSRSDQTITFLKQYDGSCGWNHSVAYDGTLSPDGTEIEGRWTISNTISGPFLMIRGRVMSEQIVRRAFEKV